MMTMTGAMKAQMKFVSYLSQHLKREIDGETHEHKLTTKGYVSLCCCNLRLIAAIMRSVTEGKAKWNSHCHVEQREAWREGGRERALE